MSRLSSFLSFKSAVIIAAVSICLLSHPVLSQETKDTQSAKYFGGAVTVTNNGISLIPSFSLGKPATILDMRAGGEKLSFEPQMRFSLEGEPWSFIFWWRYKLLNNEKFSLRIGAHPAFLFSVQPTGGFLAKRYIAQEFVPNYNLTKNISIGSYILNANGVDPKTIGNTNFIALYANFSSINLTEQIFMKFNPQVFYLRMDDKFGYYATATVTLGHRQFPVSIQSILNQAIKTSIVAKDEFVWNVSLVYSFGSPYIKN